MTIVEFVAELNWIHRIQLDPASSGSILDPGSVLDPGSILDPLWILDPSLDPGSLGSNIDQDPIILKKLIFLDPVDPSIGSILMYPL